MTGSPGPSRTEATSGTLTFLFTDLAGSTQLWERLPEAMTDALQRHDTLLHEAIASSGGRVVKTTGDGMMAVFPTAGEAVAASLAAQRALTAEPWGETGALRVRMGLHAGEAEQRADDYFGPTINRAARIMAAGHGGQVLLSASAAALAADRLPAGAALRDLGEHRLKDLGRPERIFQLVHPDLAEAFPPLSTLDRAVGNLPAQAAAFVGRETELAELGRRLVDPSMRLLTLTGPGGTGKTSLAVRAAGIHASAFPDGAFFVDLANAADTDAVLVALARVIDLGEVIDRPLLDELTDRLRDRRMLLVLDNFEQVTEAAGVVVRLLTDCPGIKLLVTSREPVKIRAENVYPVPPLSLPPAGLRLVSAAELAGVESVQLFVERGRAIRPDFELTDENAAVIAEICRRLDGLPLAIELAAARLRLFSPDVLRDRLRSGLDLLRSASRDLPARQQTLRATIEWSYQLLDPGEQRLFEMLAAFADADLVAVEAVAAGMDGAGPAVDPVDGLASLVEKSLIRQVEAPAGEPRLAMLETIREYAAERLDLHADVGRVVRRAQATYYADFAARLRRDLTGTERERALAAMTTEVRNLRIAWRYWVGEADLERLNQLADSLLILNDARGWYLDTVVITTDLLAVLATTSSTPELIGQEIALRTSLARALLATRGYTPEVEEAYARALDLFEQGGTGTRQHYSVLRGLASLYLLRAEFMQADRLGARILELAEAEGDTAMMIDGHLIVGSTLTFVTDLPAGLAHLEAAIDLFEASPRRSSGFRPGNDPRVACLTTSAFALWLLGYPDRAAERARSALALAAELGHPFTSAYASFHAGLLHFWRREPDIVLERAVRVLEIADEHDFQIWTAVGTCLLGAAQAGLGRADEGLAAIRKGLDLYQGIRTPPVFWPMLLFLDATSNHLAGRSARGLAQLEPAIEIFGAGAGSTMLPELYVLKGDLLSGLGMDDTVDQADPDAWYRHAFDLAEGMGMRSSQLRAAVRLARPSPDRDEAEGRRRLRAIVDTFTEGFGTADVVEARALLAAGPAG
jgi:predicted ATPase/class 3 adenylate cyclase